MALARVQGTGKVISDAAGSVSVTFATPPAVGNAVVVLVTAFGGATAGFTACTDNRGNTYAQAIAQNNSNVPEVAVYACAAITASSAPFTVTVTGPGTIYWVVSAIEVSGVGTGLTVDRTVGQTAASASPTTGATAALTTTADALLVAVLSVNGAEAAIGVESVSPAWTEEHEELSFSHAVGEGDTRVVPAAAGTTPSCTWTLSTGRNFAATLVAFKAGAPATTALMASAGVRVSTSARLTLATTALVASASVRVSTTAQLILVTTPLRASAAVRVSTAATLTPVGRLRVTQTAADVFVGAAATARTTQLAVEAFHPVIVPLRSTQQPVELFDARAAALRVSQAPVEVFLVPRPRRLIRRLRRAPHVADEHRRIAYAKFALDLQRGVGALAGQGANPVVTLRVSRDGGRTWGEPVPMRAGTLGASTTRVLARRLGQARDAVFEVTVSDPVAWSLVQAWLDLEPGTS